MAKTLAWGYFGFGFVLALLLLQENSKKIAIKVVPDVDEKTGENKDAQLSVVRKQSVG